MFTAWTCHEGAVSVDVFGSQSSNGGVERAIVDSGGDDAMTAAQARARAGAPLEPADVLEAAERR